MRLQISTSLALYSVLEFAVNTRDPISAADIASKYRVSTHHLAKVLRELVRAGILESARGVGGGYRFGGSASRLTLLDIIELFEDIGEQPGRNRQTGASTHVGRALDVVLAEIDEIAKATFRSITVDTMLKLIEHQRTKERSPVPKRARA